MTANESASTVAPSPEVARQRAPLGHLVSEPDATIAVYRRLYDEVLANFEVPAYARSEQVEAAGVPSYWVAAPGVDDGLVTVLVHGGGWTMGTAKG